jgi:hypothetical protein
MSAPIITTGQIAKLLWPGLNARWGADYDQHPVEYTDLVDVFTSDMAYEEDQEMTGFGLAPIKTQGASIAYDTLGQGPTTRYTHIMYALGFIITHEAMKDNQYEKVGMQRTGNLAFLDASDEGERGREPLQPRLQFVLRRRGRQGASGHRPPQPFGNVVERAGHFRRYVGSQLGGSGGGRSCRRRTAAA